MQKVDIPTKEDVRQWVFESMASHFERASIKAADEILRRLEIRVERMSASERVADNFPIHGLPLSTKTKNALDNAGLHTILELENKTEADLMRLRNFGRTGLAEVKFALKRVGRNLGISASEAHPNNQPRQG